MSQLHFFEIQKFGSLKKSLPIFGLLAGLLATPGSAAIVSADFEAEFDVPSISFGPRIFRSLGEDVSGAPDLSVADEFENLSGWSGYATTDLTVDGLITLSGDGGAEGLDDYDLFTVTISNIVFDRSGEKVSGVSLIIDDLMSSRWGFPVPAPTIGWTADSVTISYDATGYGDVSDFVLQDFESSTFQINTAIVPLPATLPLLLAGLAGLGYLGRRRRGRLGQH